MRMEDLRRIESSLRKNLADFRRGCNLIENAYNERVRTFAKVDVNRIIEEGMTILESNSDQLFDIIFPDIDGRLERSKKYACLRDANVFNTEIPKYLELISGYILQVKKGFG